MSPDKITITDFFKELQKSIIASLEKIDGGSKFVYDEWARPEGGGGLSSVIDEGNVIEKGGVNFSTVFGPAPDFLKTETGNKTPANFYATGVSIVLHSQNPWMPIIHMNVRYFEMGDTWWFGGGIDLTPHYVIEEEAVHFHSQLKKVCDKHHVDFYPKFSKWANEYFYIKHRGETRGIGGIFFDHLHNKNTSLTKMQLFEFVKEVGNSFAGLYAYHANLNREKSFGEKEKQWQHLRRGRYVEFNLVYDRGTRFGLETNGRTESILMSLPKNASWLYNYVPENGSLEEKTLKYLSSLSTWEV
jgi:coproporphyrinogen III oxidase